jgi:hypothetical protein
MTALNPFDVLLVMTITLFILGVGTFLAGILIVALRSPSNDIKVIANQTAQLAQKGIAEDVAGLVGNASTLLDALNQLTRTTSGIGAFLAILGLIVMALACWITILIYKMLP